MRRWPSWLLRTLIPVLIIGALIGFALLQPLFILPGAFLGLVVAGCFMVLSDRRRARAAAESVAYRGPGQGVWDGLYDQTAVRYGFWQWMLGDGPQVPSDASHQMTPRQNRVAARVHLVVAAVFTLAVFGLIVLGVVINSVQGWWGTDHQWGPIALIGIASVTLIMIGGIASLPISDARRRARARRARAASRARRVAKLAAESSGEGAAQ